MKSIRLSAVGCRLSQTAVLALVASLGLGFPSAARAGWAEARPGDSIALNPTADGVLIGVGALGFILPELMKQRLAPAQCNWCDGGPAVRKPGVDYIFAPPDAADAWFHDHLTGWLIARKSADTASNVYAFALLPAGALLGAAFATGPHASEGAGLRAGAIVLEGALVSAALVQSVKFFAARQRPFAHYNHGTEGKTPGEGGTYDLTDADSHLGFPSGHTAFAASLGVGMAMTATLQDSPAAPWLWGAAAAMTVTTASLRMMAEKHYFTDVLTGALIGTGTAVALPLLHRNGRILGSDVTVSALSVLPGSAAAANRPASSPSFSIAGVF